MPGRRDAAGTRLSRRARHNELLAARSVLQAADRIAHFALHLLAFAFGLRLLVAGRLAGPLLHLALGLLGRAFDAILVNHVCLLLQARTARPMARFRPRRDVANAG